MKIKHVVRQDGVFRTQGVLLEVVDGVQTCDGRLFLDCKELGPRQRFDIFSVSDNIWKLFDSGQILDVEERDRKIHLDVVGKRCGSDLVCIANPAAEGLLSRAFSFIDLVDLRYTAGGAYGGFSYR